MATDDSNQDWMDERRMTKDRTGCMFVYDVDRQVGWNGRPLEGQEQNAIG